MAVTIYDLAEAAGVSIATVSKALSDSYSVSEATKQRIRELAAEMEYIPNARARSFARQRSGIVLFITDMYRNIAYENPHMFEIMTGVTQYLDSKNYSLLVKHMSRKEAPDAIRELMLREQADGVILHAAILSKQLVNVLTVAKLPHLVIGKPDLPTRVCWIDVNHELAGQKAATYLLDRGYRKMTFLMGRQGEDMISEHRRAGMQAMFDEEELTFRTLYGNSSYEDGLRQMEEAMTTGEKPDIVVCTNNYLAMGCLQYARNQGLRVPEDVAVMTFDNYPLSMITQPPLTAVEADMFDMGQEAARFILHKIRKPEIETQSYCTVPRVNERMST